MDSGVSELSPDQMERSEIAREPTCPLCQSRVVRRTKRRGILERIVLYPLGFRAYRCEFCDHRFCLKIKAASPEHQ
jgi:hypothetical protein